MERSANLGGKTAQLRLRRLPREPQVSKSKAPPVQLPLDFYHPRWYNGLSAHDKEKYVKHTQVAFLPNAAESFIPPPHTHPDEKLSGAKFNKKYYDQLKSPYQLNTPGEEEDDAEGPVGRGDQGNHEEEMEDSIDLEAISEGSDEEDKAANSKFFQTGITVIFTMKRRRMKIGTPRKMRRKKTPMNLAVTTATLVWLRGMQVSQKRRSEGFIQRVSFCVTG